MEENTRSSITANRIRTIRDRHRGDTQEVIAEYLGYSVVQYGRIERGESPIKRAKLEMLAARWNIALQYFTGEEENPISPLEYATKQNLLLAKKGAVEDLWRSVQNNDERRSIIFTVFGYEYKHEITGQIEFAEFAHSPDDIKSMSPDAGWHFIRPRDKAGAAWTAFSEDELHALIDKLKDMIAFECYKQGKRGGTFNGDD